MRGKGKRGGREEGERRGEWRAGRMRAGERAVGRVESERGGKERGERQEARDLRLRGEGTGRTIAWFLADPTSSVSARQKESAAAPSSILTSKSSNCASTNFHVGVGGSSGMLFRPCSACRSFTWLLVKPTDGSTSSEALTSAGLKVQWNGMQGRGEERNAGRRRQGGCCVGRRGLEGRKQESALLGRTGRRGGRRGLRSAA